MLVVFIVNGRAQMTSFDRRERTERRNFRLKTHSLGFKSGPSTTADAIG